VLLKAQGLLRCSILLTPPKALRRKVAPDQSLPLSPAGSDAVPVVVSQPRDGLRLIARLRGCASGLSPHLEGDSRSSVST
jgi:hypothetical protein